MSVLSRLSPSVLAVLGAALVLAPALAWLPGAEPHGSGPPLFPAGDHAVLEIYTRLAATGDQQLGPYSRFHFHHPGPALFYASLPVYVLAGGAPEGLKLAALFLNALSLVGLLWLSRRLGGVAGYLGLLVGLCAFALWWGPMGFFSSWNPSVAVLPFGVGVLAWTAVASGRPALLPLAVAASSFAVQTHVACAPVSFAVAAASLGLSALPRFRDALRLPPVAARSWVRPAVAAVAVAAVLWALPVAEELDPAGGNLGRLLEVSRRSPARHPSLSDAMAALSENAAAFLLGTGSDAPVSRVLFVVLAMGLAGAFVAAYRSRAPFGIALPLVTVAGMAAAVYSTTRIPGWAQPYLLGWMSMLGLFAVLAVAVGLDTSLLFEAERRRRLAGFLAVAAVGASVGFGVSVARALLRAPADLPDAQSAWVRALAEPAAPALRTCGMRRPLVEVERAVPRAVAVGLLLHLDKAGVRFGVTPFGPYKFGGRFVPDGTEDATLLVGAENSAWTGRPGARVLATEGGVFVYLLPGPPSADP